MGDEKKHAIDDTGDGSEDCTITCRCAQIFSGYSWQDVGGQFDQHLENVDYS